MKKSIQTTYLFPAIIFLFAGFGCAGNGDSVKDYTYKPRLPGSSYAYSVASQTALVDDNSKLKDLDEGELPDGVGLSSVGEMGLLNAAVNLASLNPLGAVVHLLGASLESESDHAANNARWIVMVKQADYASPREAQLDVVSKIQVATIDALSAHGSAKYENDGFFDFVKIDDLNVGGHISNNFKNGKKLNYRSITKSENGKLIKYYGFGFGKENFAYAPMVSIFNEKKADRRINITELLTEISANLPDNFYIYNTPFNRISFERKYYYDRSVVIPYLVEKGKVHYFIKPSKLNSDNQGSF